VTKDNDDNVGAAKLRQQLKAEGNLGQELKRRGLLPDLGRELKRLGMLPDGSAFRHQRPQSPSSKLTEKPERARKQAAVREIARRRFADGGVPPQMTTAQFMRECVDEDWALVAPRYGLDPKPKTKTKNKNKHPVDWHTVHKAIGREV
jgi:hypothetical protein